MQTEPDIINSDNNNNNNNNSQRQRRRKRVEMKSLLLRFLLSVDLRSFHNGKYINSHSHGHGPNMEKGFDWTGGTVACAGRLKLLIC